MARSIRTRTAALSLSPGDRVAERAGKLAQDRGPQEEEPVFLGLAVQDLVDEVVHDVAMGAGHRRDQARHVSAPLEGDGDQLQPDDPALGAGLEGRHVPALRSQAHHAVQERLGFFEGEEELGAADLDQLIARPQATEGQRRVGARGDDEVDLRGRLARRKATASWTAGRADRVVVVQDEDQVAGQSAQVVQERGQDVPGRRGLRGPEHGQGSRAHALLHPVEGRDDVGEEPHRVVVVLVEREPGGGDSYAPARPATRPADVVLPNPTGAEMRVSARLSPAFSRSVRRARDTRLPAPGAGAASWPGAGLTRQGRCDAGNPSMA